MRNQLPTDPFILLSYINTKLRDYYSSLSELCASEDLDCSDIVSRLAAIGYVYDKNLNKFI